MLELGDLFLVVSLSQTLLIFQIANYTGTTGGISYISRRYGWAIDNVKNFEVCFPLPHPSVTTSHDTARSS